MASSTDALVADITKYSKENNFKDLADLLKGHESGLADTDPSVLDTMIECLNSSSHSLGVLAAL